MKPEAQRIAIAESLGWTINPYPWTGGKRNAPIPGHETRGYPPGFAAKRGGKNMGFVPDYLNDLNAMHEAEKTINPDSMANYVQHLWQIMEHSKESEWGTVHATAAQRAEAFLRTIGKWKD